MISTADRRRPRLETVRRRLNRWRQTRVHARAPLPDRLWAAMVALVPEYGLYGTARALGVSYGALKRQVDRRDDEREHTSARFIELPPTPVANGYVIEIDSGAGTMVRVRLNGLPLSEVAEFTRRVAGTTS